MNKLANILIQKGFLKSDQVIDAFSAVPRVEFMPARFRTAAEADIPIPLGYGQMMPSPSVVAYMVELLDAHKGQNVLVAGFGAGWVSALLCHIVGADGHVTSCDSSQAMENDARKNIARFSFIEKDHIIDFYTISTCDDVPLRKPFDRIIVLNPYFVGCPLENRLAKKGILVTPRNNVVHYYKKNDDGELEETVYSGIEFLPL